MKKPIRILAVDDDGDIRQVLTLLYAGTYAIECVSTLEEAGQRLEGGAYDLLLLDQHLPDGEGTEFLGRVRSQPRYSKSAQIPVIMLTAAGTGAVYETSWDLGSVAFVTKPFEVPELSSAIERATAESANLQNFTSV